MKKKLARFGSQIVTMLTLWWLYRVENFPFGKCAIVWGAFCALYVLTLLSEGDGR